MEAQEKRWEQGLFYHRYTNKYIKWNVFENYCTSLTAPFDILKFSLIASLRGILVYPKWLIAKLINQGVNICQSNVR